MTGLLKDCFIVPQKHLFMKAFVTSIKSKMYEAILQADIFSGFD